MTNEQINITIAKACGMRGVWEKKITSCGCDGQWDYFNPQGNRLPDYCNDLNAMHEAEKVLTIKQKQRYATALSNDLSDSAPTDSCHTVWSDTIHATALQRAEAFLKNINKWED
jgi:hypothetical protein